MPYLAAADPGLPRAHLQTIGLVGYPKKHLMFYLPSYYYDTMLEHGDMPGDKDLLNLEDLPLILPRRSIPSPLYLSDPADDNQDLSSILKVRADCTPSDAK